MASHSLRPVYRGLLFITYKAMDSIALILGIGTGVLSVCTFLGGFYAYLKSSERKKYASEREIGHVKNSIQQMSQNVDFLTKEIDRRLDSIDLKLLEIGTKIETDMINPYGKNRDTH